MKLPNEHYGDTKDIDVDWRSRLKDEDEPDDDEERPTPPEVIAMLGFDPAKED